MPRDDTATAEPRDEGFALVEVVVALGIVMVVMTALLPQLIVGVRSTETARLISQAKGVAQGEIEHMRNLPWHVAPDTADPYHEYHDVFDSYFPDVDQPSVTPVCTDGDDYAVPDESWTGYVPATGGTRCDYEPHGPLYRTVVHRSSPRFMVVIDVQFLTTTSPPTWLEPDADYDTNDVDKDSPVAGQVGVTVTVLYEDQSTSRPVSTYTEISEQRRAETRVFASADSAAVDVVSMTPTDGAVSMGSAVLHLRGELANSSTVGVTLAGATGGLGTGARDSGANASVTAPWAADVANDIHTSRLAGGLLGSCAWTCWGNTQVSDDSGLSTADGRPIAGTQLEPLQALLTSKDNSGLTFRTESTDTYRSGLGIDGPLVSLADGASAGLSGVAAGCTGPATSGPSSFASAAGYLSTSAADPVASSSVEACTVTRASAIQLFKTGFAPHGVVQVELDSATARCRVSGATHAPATSYSYRARVLVHDPAKDADEEDDDDYTAVAVIDSTVGGPDPLASVPMSMKVGGGLRLGNFISSWSSPTAADVEKSTTGKASVKVPGAVTLSSLPLRTGTESVTVVDPETGEETTLDDVDSASSMTATFGAVSCSALDAR